ncbi:MAG: hypothetical protein MZV63_14695 [Marinilabiliales bacterium]|nr:hypothetical protein [Marinilabiliales bacterium]
MTAFSKKFSDKSNPQSGFIAVMTCTDADEACPFVPESWRRVSLPYADPKSSDGTPQQDEIYLARSIEIATEMVFGFSEVKKI